ncbi:MAG TPA: hypothetical protein VMZ26_03530 [Pyrinomonadaceae bacterium]|nr:hypothetical protein [Pyrinomonadaceae bacterium]
MFPRFANLIVFALLVGCAAMAAYSQSELPDASVRSSRQQREDPPLGLKEMLAKQKAERDKKDHEALLERGDEALRLTQQLENSFAEKKGLSQQDRTRLESLEKVVGKIRKELGGDDDADDAVNSVQPADEPKPSTMEEAFKYLQSTTVKLVDELKKTTRFSISAIAIQSSNTVLKLVRFLRVKK